VAKYAQSIFVSVSFTICLLIHYLGGEIIVIDKSQSAMGLLKIEEWEQWFTDDFFKKTTKNRDCQLRIIQIDVCYKIVSDKY